jgi:hypothetical protein
MIGFCSYRFGIADSGDVIEGRRLIGADTLQRARDARPVRPTTVAEHS